MADPVSVPDGTLLTKRTTEQPVYVFDWDTRGLDDGVLIDTYGIVITALDRDPGSPISLDYDSDSLLTGDRKVRLRLLDGLPEALYRVDHIIVTDEAPARTLIASLLVRVR